MTNLAPEDQWLVDGDGDASLTVILAHGAGAPMDSPFMAFFAAGLAVAGFRAVRFEFPYMRRRRVEGTKAGPDRMPVLEDCWRSTVAEVGARFHIKPSEVVIGGKSMGGRAASMVADELGVAGLLCLGYPFHPSGKPDRLRIGHLFGLQCPCLIAQGSRDTLGDRDEVPAYGLPSRIRLTWLEDGDHSFKPRKKSGRTEAQNLDLALGGATDFLQSLLAC